MGCGKSSVGRELARLLCCPFVDLDSVIEDRAGRSIPEIFASDGEAVFRRMEAEALYNIVAQPVDSVGPRLRFAQADAPLPHLRQSALSHDGHYEAVVLALGGGTVMTPECAELVHEKTLCVYLRASLETLVRNLEGEADGRPMLASGEPLDVRIAALMALRASTYERTAHIIIDTDGKSVKEIAKDLYINNH